LHNLQVCVVVFCLFFSIYKFAFLHFIFLNLLISLQVCGGHLLLLHADDGPWVKVRASHHPRHSLEHDAVHHFSAGDHGQW